MILENKKILLQYSGGKDSTACLIKLLEEGAYVEAVHFTHAYGYQLPTDEAKRICNETNTLLHLIDVTDEIESLFLNDFSQRPCRFCKGIMDKITVELAKEQGFDYICVGDTASDRTLIERIKKSGESSIMVSSYFNMAVELPKEIKIIRPLIEYDNEEVFEYLAQHSVCVKRNNDTGDKYFEYSREGCPLQFKDYGIHYSRQLMENLKIANTLCSEFATSKGIKASIHLPGETIVTIPKGFEKECQIFLERNGFPLKNRYEVSGVSNLYCFSVSVYKEICNVSMIEELFVRFLERMAESVKNVSRGNDFILIKSDLMDIDISILNGENRVLGHMSSIKKIEVDEIDTLFIELFHTYDFNISELTNNCKITLDPVLPGVLNCRYVAGGRYGKKYIRSNSLDTASTEEIITLRNLGVSTIIDLRNEKKCHQEQISLFIENGMKYLRFPFVGDNLPENKRTDDVNDVVTSYLRLIKQSEVMREIFITLCETEGKVLFFCKHGKDRTGIVAMILELLCEIPLEVIAVDYSISGLYLAPDLYRDKVFDMTADIPLGFIKEFQSQYGSAFNYVRELGIQESEIQKIKNGMV